MKNARSIDDDLFTYGVCHLSLSLLKAQRNDLRKAERQRKKKELQDGCPASEESHAMETEASRLIAEAKPLLDMPALAPRDIILMSDTRLSNAFVMQVTIDWMLYRLSGMITYADKLGTQTLTLILLWCR